VETFLEGAYRSEKWWCCVRTPNLEYFDFLVHRLPLWNYAPSAKWDHEDVQDVYRNLCGTTNLHYLRVGDLTYLSRRTWMACVPWPTLREIDLDHAISHIRLTQLLEMCTCLEAIRVSVDKV
jgi:hypothetical protein